MKKILLAAALIAVSASAYAALPEFGETFEVTLDGEMIENGATVNALNYEEANPVLYGEGFVTYSLDINVENLDIQPQWIRGTLGFTNQPSSSEYLANMIYWGDPQLCYSTTTVQGTVGNCLSGDPYNIMNPNLGAGNLEVPVSFAGEFTWQLHVVACDAKADASYTLLLQHIDVADPTNPSVYTVASKPYVINLKFNAAASSGIDSVDAAQEPGEYFDLQGRRVANPAKGIYIYKQGNKAVKRIVK